MSAHTNCAEVLDDLLNRISILAERYRDHAGDWRQNAALPQDESTRQNALRRQEVLLVCARDLEELINDTDRVRPV